MTLHPFDDGNGRIARAVGDLYLTRADGSRQRYYSLSAEIQRERNAYYEALERTQKGSLDITAWLWWFLGVLERALKSAGSRLDDILAKARFWQRHGGLSLNERQAKVLNRLLARFEGNLTTSKWAALANCSPDTALRDTQGEGLLRAALPARHQSVAAHDRGRAHQVQRNAQDQHDRRDDAKAAEARSALAEARARQAELAGQRPAHRSGARPGRLPQRLRAAGTPGRRAPPPPPAAASFGKRRGAPSRQAWQDLPRAPIVEG